MAGSGLNEPDHYETFLTKPRKDSRYEYLLRSFTILYAEPVAALWMTSRVSPPRGATERDARLYARFNQSAEWNAAFWERQAAERLESIGVTTDRHEEPQVRKVLDEFAHGIRVISYVAFGNGPLSTWSVDKRIDRGYPKALCRDVIWSVWVGLDRPGPSAVAKFLNEGTRHGLEPDHVYRALKAHTRSWPKGAPRNREKFELWKLAKLAHYRIMVDRVSALRTIAAHARFKPDLKHLHGAALAEAIHEKYDLYERMERVERMRRASRAAA